jgi:hypothetical protein
MANAKARVLVRGVTAALCLGVCACSVMSDSAFECAALIGAADRLMVTKTVESDGQIIKNGLVASMGYLNLFALSRKLGEKEAFAAVLAERDRLVKSEPPAGIVRRARACISQSRMASRLSGR